MLNARDALPAGGEIRLEVALVPAVAGRRCRPISRRHGGDLVRLRVVDNGVGMSPEARAHLFEPFFTTKDVGKGTGLGLASVYGIVRQSNGFITVESEPGAGSDVHDALSARRRRRRGRRAGRGRAPSRPRGSETVLLVEDEDSVRAIISAVLRRQGYQVLEASGARDGVRDLRSSASDIDLLLTDVVMPDMNGPALAQRLIGLRPELRVLFISGYADMLSPPGGDNPNVGFLSKPFQASALTARVAQMLARPKAPGQDVTHDGHACSARSCENAPCSVPRTGSDSAGRTCRVAASRSLVRQDVRDALEGRSVASAQRAGRRRRGAGAEVRRARAARGRLPDRDRVRWSGGARGGGQARDVRHARDRRDDAADDRRRAGAAAPRRPRPALKVLYLTGFSDRLFKERSRSGRTRRFSTSRAA